MGILPALLTAIEIATGEFIALLDHDDLLTPDALYEGSPSKPASECGHDIFR